ncbi:MAG: Tad domain-containing protein [Acidimicrobiia bacterium]|nr:Tad domain-containing protein [Acidimicrobiia bacterium]
MAITVVVLFGMLGLTVDVGALYYERRQLSNGADAAVLAIAEDCALGVGSCDPASARVIAESFADANARDGYAIVEALDLDAVAKRVRVVTGTLTASGGRILEPFFAQVIGFDGTTVHADATAVWGYPSSMRNVLPLIISLCEFPGAATLPGPLEVLFFHDGNSAESCNAQAGQDTDGDNRLAGGFGWLATTGACAASMAQGAWVVDDPGASPSNGCSASFIGSLLGTAVPLPIFDDITGTGSNGQYHVAGFAMFVITGYNFGGQFKALAPCLGDERCVSGYFTTGVVHDGELGGTDRGIVIVKLTD